MKRNSVLVTFTLGSLFLKGDLIKVLTLVLVFIFLYKIEITAQKSWLNDVSPHSPNASSLGKFGDIPIGNYTGTPHISIPIYTIESGSFQIPVSLKYHASGLKINEMSSWVGMGWALDAGGCISRRVRGVADEGPVVPNIKTNGYYQNYGPNMVLDHGPENNFVMRGILTESYDVEPDLFFFNFGSYSGSFFFDQYRKPHSLPEKDLKIEVIYTEGTPGKFNQFIITTPDGVKYYFGGFGNNNVEAIEYTYPNYAANNVNKGFISNWYLTKIETPDNSDVVNLEYEAETYKFYNIAQFSQIIKEGNCAGVSVPSQNYSEDQISGVRLSKINDKNLYIEFSVDFTNPRKDVHDGSSYYLKSVSVRNKTGSELVKRFDFGYHWEDCPGIQIQAGQNPYLNKDKWRLILDQVQEVTPMNGVINPYVFSYYQLPSSAEADGPKLPRRLSYDQDHWGYFNNAGNTKQNWLLPSLSFENFSCSTINNIGNANRNPHWPSMRAGTLKSIQYPTGGTTLFEFEPHKYYARWTEPVTTSTFPISVGNGSSSGTNSSGPITYTYPIPASGETVVAELSAQVTVSSTSPNCAEVHLYDDNNGGAEIAGFSFDCSQSSYPFRKISISLIAGRTYGLRLVATNCMAQVIVSKTSIVAKEGYKDVGGLRIVKMSDNPGNNLPVMEKSFEYSDAALFFEPVYQRKLIRKVDEYSGGEEHLVCTEDAGKRLYQISSSSVMPMLLSQGNHIGYGTVTVKETGKGKSVYIYTNLLPSEYLALQFLEYPTPPPPHLFENGNLRREEYYNENNTLIKEVDNEYETVYYNEINVPSVNFVSVFVPPTCTRITNDPSQFYSGFNYELWTTYTLKSGYSRIKKRTETERTGNGNFFTQTEFVYSSKYIDQVKEEIQNTSDNDVRKKSTNYPKDYLPVYQYSPSCYQVLEAAKHNCLQTYLNDDDQYLSCVSSAESAYKPCINTYNQSYNNIITSDKSGSDAYTQILYDLSLMNKSLPIEEIVWHKEVNATDFQFLSGSFFEYGVALNDASGKQDLRLKSVFEMPVFVTDFSPTQVNNKNFTKDSRYELKVTAQYTDGRMSEVWKDKDIHTSYLYGYNNAYPVIKAGNIDFTTLNNGVNAIQANFQNFIDSSIGDLTSAGQKNQWRIFNDALRSSLPGAIISTYTYRPLVGLTSQTDPNGVTTYYEYDVFGRLKCLKDDDGRILKTYDYHYKQ